MAADSIAVNLTAKRAQGWDRLVAELRASAMRLEAERERLLGPDRGE